MKKVFLFIIAAHILLGLGCSNTNKEDFNKFDFNSSKQEITTSSEFYFEKHLNRIEINPTDPLNYTKLGEAYIQKGRETGNIAYFNKAEEVLKKSLELNPENYSAYIFLGQVSSYRHQFHKTLSYATKAIGLRPWESSAYGILGDAYLELGEYQNAEKAYERMLSISPDFYSYSRTSHIKELEGDIDGAVIDMRKAIQEGMRRNLPDENIAWAEVIIGSLYFNKGEVKEAEKHYDLALNLSNDYYLALEHLAEINAVQGKYEKALKLYERTLELNPKAEFYLALAGVYENLNEKEKAESMYNAASDIFEEQIVKGDYAHIREIALFYADNDKDLKKALELAKMDLEEKQDIYAFDTLAWVYYKLGRFDEALEATNQSLNLGTKDPLLFYHAGMIHHKLNSDQKAEEYLTLALSTNPYFDADAAKEIKEVLKEIADKS